MKIPIFKKRFSAWIQPSGHIWCIYDRANISHHCSCWLWIKFEWCETKRHISPTCQDNGPYIWISPLLTHNTWQFAWNKLLHYHIITDSISHDSMWLNYPSYGNDRNPSSVFYLWKVTDITIVDMKLNSVNILFTFLANQATSVILHVTVHVYICDPACIYTQSTQAKHNHSRNLRNSHVESSLFGSIPIPW